MFEALPQEAKDTYRAVRDMHSARVERLQDAIIAQIEKNMTGKAKKESLKMIRAKFEIPMEGPYFPLSRFGDHVVIATGKDDARAVSTFEKMAEAERFASNMRRKGYSVRIKKAKEYSDGDAAPHEFAQDVVNMLNDPNNKIDAKVRRDLIDKVNQSFIKALPDMSFRKHFMHRKGTAGYSRDALRAFAASSLHAAKHIARVEHGSDMTAAVGDLDKGDYVVDDKSASIEGSLRNELMKRHDLIMSPNVHPVAQVLTSFGFAWNIGPSIASAMVNLTQTPLVAYPILASKYGWRRAGGELMKAVNDYRHAAFTWESGLNFAEAKFLNTGERRMIKALIKDGTMDVSQAHDLASASATDYLSLSEVGDNTHVFAKTMKAVSWPFHVAEVANRQITALAAYRMAAKDGHESAVDYAREAVKSGHFDYSQENRARVMQGNMARVVLLFKQYSQNMTYLLVRNFIKAINKAGVSQEEVRRARVQLAGIIGGHFMVSGALGMPVLGMVGQAMNILAASFGGDDEPWDYKVEMRNFLADTLGKKGGELVAHGPARMLPVDVASRLSLSDLWWRDSDRVLDGREQFAQTMQNMAGPVASNAASMFAGAKYMAEGELWRGTEMMLPKALKDVMKSARYASSGVENIKRDVLLEDVGVLEVVGQLLGFTPSRVSEMHEGKRAVKNLEKKLDIERSRLKNAYHRAKDGKESMYKVVRGIRAWNVKHKGNESLELSIDKLRQSWKTRQRIRANTKEGIYLPGKRDWLREEGRFANI